jgi:hypothetical protein
LRLEQGRLNEARRHFAGLPTGTHTRRVNAAWLGAWIRYAEGDRRGAMRMLEDSLDVLRAGDGKPTQTMAIPYVFAAQWRLANGDARGADSLALLARSAAAIDSVALERSGYVGRAELVRARALFAQGDSKAAHAAAGRAVTALTHGFGATNRYSLEARAFRDSISP